MSFSSNFELFFRRVQTAFDFSQIRARLIPPKVRISYDLDWQERYVVVPIILSFVTNLWRNQATIRIFPPLSFFINSPRIQGFDRVSAILQVLVCVLVRLFHGGVAPDVLALFSLSCAMMDSAVPVSIAKMIVLTAQPHWRIAVFSTVLVILPLEGFGFRAYVSSYLKSIRTQAHALFFTSKMDIDREVAFFFWILPFGFLFAIAPRTRLHTSDSLAYSFSVSLLCAAAIVRYASRSIDEYLAPIMEVRIKYADSKQTELEAEGTQKEQFDFRMLLGLASGGFFNLLFAHGEYLLGAPFVILFYLALFDYRFPRAITGSRFVLVLQFVAVVAVIVRGDQIEDQDGSSFKDNLIFLISLTRAYAATCAFHKEKLSGFISDGSFAIGVLILFSRYPFAIAFLFVVSIACFFIEVFTRTGNQKLILKEREGQNFLDHAIKQKFAGTGTALEIALADELIRRYLSPDTLRVMQVALNECQLGSFLCHEATLKRQILDGTFVPKPTTRQLSSVVAEWRDNWKEIEISVPWEDGQLFLSTDWILVFQIFQALHCRGQHQNRSFYSRMTVSVSGSSKLIAQIHMISPGHFEVIRETCELFAECLGGTFVFHHGRCKLSIPVSIAPSPASSNAAVEPRNQEPTQTSVKQRETKEERATNRRVSPVIDETEPACILPSNLVFAVLDDSTMIRVNLKITLMKTFGASPASVFQGETESQANEFVPLCTQLQPDICILDENLDYTATGGSLILGSSVAEDLRTAGYRGLIVLHSANELLRDTVDYSIIDGFILKGANRVRMKNELAHILAEHNQKKLLSAE